MTEYEVRCDAYHAHLTIVLCPCHEHFSTTIQRMDVIRRQVRCFVFPFQLPELVRSIYLRYYSFRCINCFLSWHGTGSLIVPLVYLGCKLYFRDQIIPLDEIELATELAIIKRERQLEVYGRQAESWCDRILHNLF